jgi:hypothetical protein
VTRTLDLRIKSAAALGDLCIKQWVAKIKKHCVTDCAISALGTQGKCYKL